MTSLDEHIAALTGLRDLAPLARAARATQLIDEAKAVLSLERALAITQARAAGANGAGIGRSLGITSQAVGKTDRTLLRAALEILIRDGVSAARTEQLQQGLREDAPIAAVARRVVFGAKHLNPGLLKPADLAVVQQAQVRAAVLLPQQSA